MFKWIAGIQSDFPPLEDMWCVPTKNDSVEMMAQFLPLLTSLGNGELLQTLTCCAASSQVEKDIFLCFSTVQGCSLSRAMIFLCGSQVTLNLAYMHYKQAALPKDALCLIYGLSKNDHAENVFFYPELF